MIYALSWYIQDFLLVLGTGKVLVPEVFLLSMVFLSLYRPGGGVEIIWWAFFGGVLWDLRWLGFPGISSLFYLTAILTSRWVWYSLPASGRTVPVFALILWSANLPISLLRIYLGGARGASVFAAYLLQQSYILPLVLLAGLAYGWRVKNTDA